MTQGQYSSNLLPHLLQSLPDEWRQPGPELLCHVERPVLGSPHEGSHQLGGAPLGALRPVLHDEALQVRTQVRQHGVAVVAEQGL